MIVIWETLVKVWTNFGNLIDKFKVFKKIFKVFKKTVNKNLEKFNVNLKLFLLSILIAGWNVDCSQSFANFPGNGGGDVFLVPPWSRYWRWRYWGNTDYYCIYSYINTYKSVIYSLYYYCNIAPYQFHSLLILFVVWRAKIFGIVLKQSWDSVWIVLG